MTAQSLRTFTIEETLEILRGYGMKVSRRKLCEGIKQGKYKFGIVIQMEEEEYEVYPAKLFRWIAKHIWDEPVPEVPKEEATT